MDCCSRGLSRGIVPTNFFLSLGAFWGGVSRQQEGFCQVFMGWISVVVA